MNLEILTKPLSMDEIDFKVKTAFKTTKGATALILAYKSSRTDMNRFDEAVGHLGWSNHFQRDSKGVLQCTIGIFSPEINDFVWKASNGVESDFEKEKGEYSDALKRTGFMWGIGRELYSYPIIKIPMDASDWYNDNGKVKVKASFNPNDFKWIVYGDKHNTMKNLQAKRLKDGQWQTIYDSNVYFKGYIQEEQFNEMLKAANTDPDVVRSRMNNYLFTQEQEKKLMEIVG